MRFLLRNFTIETDIVLGYNIKINCAEGAVGKGSYNMSASTERKNRQAARSEGTYKKDIAAQKEAAKRKKENTKWIIIGIAVVLFFAFTIYLNSGAMYRSLDALTVTNSEVTVGDTTISADSCSFSVAEVNYLYNMQFINILNTYGDYVSMLGLDPTKPLDEQQCSISAEAAEEGTSYTWHEYFLDSAKTQLTQFAAFAAYAEENGIALDDADNAEIDEALESISATAKENNYANANKFLTANYGKGCNEAVVRRVMEMQLLAGKVQDSISGAAEYTADELAAKYETVKDSYDKFTYSYYLVAAETVENEDGTTAEPTDEAKAEAKATADSIFAKLGEGSALADAAKAVVADAEVSEKADVAGSSVEADISEWLKSADRVKGDSAVIEGGSGSYVVVFTSRDNNQAPNEESGDMNYCDYIADGLLRNEVLNKWGEDVFNVIVEAYENETHGSVRYVGR